MDTQQALFFENLTVKFIKETRKDIREYWLEDRAAKMSRKIWHFDYKDWSADQELPDAIQLYLFEYLIRYKLFYSLSAVWQVYFKIYFSHDTMNIIIIYYYYYLLSKYNFDKEYISL